MHDLTAVCDLAIRTRAVVVAAAEGVAVVPDGMNAPERLDMYCTTTTVARPSGTVRIYTLRDDVVADLERQIRGEQ